jgi:hypothetical protein
MSGYPPPYPPPPQTPPGPPYGPPYGGPYRNDYKYQRRILRDQARAQREVFKAQRAAYRAQYRIARRGSIVGPILVIAIGVLFLLVQTHKLPADRLWNWFGNYWPLLLIGVGTVVLIEWGVDQLLHRNDSQPYFRRSIGGGVVALIIVMIVLGLVFEGIHDGGRQFFAHNFDLNQEDIDQFLGDKHESDQTIAQAFPVLGTLSVDNPRGDVTISGTSDDNQIHVIAHKEIYTRTDSDAAAKAQQLNPNLTSSGTQMALVLPAIEGARVDLIITLPSNSGQTVIANHGDIHLTGINGPVTLTANHGDMEVSGIAGPVSAHIQNAKSSFTAEGINGPLNLEGRGDDVTITAVDGPVSMQGDFFGSTHLERLRGGFKFHSSRTDFQIARLDGEANFTDDDLSADQAVGPVVLSTRNRNITLDRVTGDITVTNRNGKVDLTSAPPIGNLTVENRNGEVSLTLPDQASFHVTAETSDADIENDFSLPVVENNNRKSVTGTVGKGNSTIKITTSQEDVAIKRASIAPLPPLAPLPPALPPEAKQAIRDAQRAGDEARRTGSEVRRQAQRTADEARKAAEEAKKTLQDTAHP